MKPRVLIIDDQRDYRELLGHHILCEWPDAEVVKYDPVGGEPLGERFDGDDFDVVLLDYELGGQNGITLLRRFKAVDGFPPVVFLTEEGDELLAVAAIKAGADDCIPKSRISNSYLVNAIKQSMARDTADSQTIETLIRSGPQMALASPSDVPGYERIRRLAAAAESTVWLARRESDQRELVLKSMARLPDDAEGGLLGDEFLETCASFEALDHAGIAHMYDHGIEDGRPWLAMEYFPHGHLGRRLGAPVAPAVAVDYIRQLASALDVLHYCDIIHGDLKPANVMFRDDDTLAIADFGIVRRFGDKDVLTVPGNLLAGAFYTSPEQAAGGDVDVRTDLYALGLIFFELLSGRKPYTAASPLAVLHKHCHGSVPPLDPSLADIEPLVVQLLAKQPADRPQTAVKVLELLTDAKRL